METAYSVTVSEFTGNPTGPKLQGLLKIIPLIESVFFIGDIWKTKKCRLLMMV